VAEPLLDDLYRDPPLEEHGRVAVPEVVQGPPVRKSQPPAHWDEMIRPEIVVVERLAVRFE
jgi:hypothetical protein